MIRRLLLTVIGAACAAAMAAPVAVDWKAQETMPAKVARPFAGFLPDGRFVVAGGSDFVDGKKVYRSGIYARELDGKWSKVGELPRAVAEGVSCETPKGLLCAGGADGKDKFSNAFLLSVENGKADCRELPDALPEPVVMGAAAADDSFVYVVAGKKVYRFRYTALFETSDASYTTKWQPVGEIPGPAREQHVAAIQNGDQKEKMLVIYGGFDAATKQPLHDGYALVLSRIPSATDNTQTLKNSNTQTLLKLLSPLPENTTTIGSAFLPSGHQHILLIGGFGEKGWIDRAVNGSTETDPVKLGWPRKIYAYNCVTNEMARRDGLAT